MSLHSVVGKYSLHNAVDRKLIDKVTELLHEKEFINKNEKDACGNIPLHSALEGAVMMKEVSHKVNNIIIIYFM